MARLKGIGAAYIGQDADIAPPGGLGLRLDVAGELLQSLGFGPSTAKIALYFDNGGADFNVDAAAVAKRVAQYPDSMSATPVRK
ncbi:MAG: hypothetical protein KJ587_14440 [Alphaproteobacteria bacterium]|nr:hypothetical protein [Alphaproteobacteria bacterium]